MTSILSADFAVGLSKVGKVRPVFVSSASREIRIQQWIAVILKLL